MSSRETASRAPTRVSARIAARDIKRAVAASRTAEPALGRPVKIIDHTGKLTQLRPLKTVGLRRPVYFSSSAHLHEKQPGALPVLLMTRRDLHRLMADTHPGAFGDDHGTKTWVTVHRDKILRFDPRDQWHAVWKFPADMFSRIHPALNTGARVRPILRIPLPVGQYPLVPDAWSAGYGSPAPHQVATKWRVLLGGARPALHFLQCGDRRLAAVSSMYWFSDFWATRPDEEAEVRRVLERLSAVGISAFSCHGQHHAIVFHDSPEAIAERLREREVFDAISAERMRAHEVLASIGAGGPVADALQRWRAEYRRVFSC